MHKTTMRYENDPADSRAGRCPFDHGATRAVQKTTPAVEPAGPPVARDEQGVWHVRGYDAARAILRSDETGQAGFKAEDVAKAPLVNKPVLYMDGAPHHEQRRRTARFFTPRATHAYRGVMAAYAHQVLDPLRSSGRADLSDLSMKMAVQVAAQVVGLTESRRPGLERRLASFFEEGETTPGEMWSWAQRLRNYARLGAFFFLDVQPAIRARRKVPGADVISHLIESGYSQSEILSECIMYGAAGMATTREFICAAAWHLLESAERREWFLASDEESRYAFLHETLRLEPVVGHLYRRATADLAVPVGETAVTIPRGALIDLHVYAINADQSVVGEQPLELCPGRPLRDSRVPAEVMGFGDGHHRCAGAYVAIQETDVFLQALLALPGLRVERWPTLGWSAIAKGYELRDFIVVATPDQRG